MIFFFKQKTAYEMRISDWSSDVCSSDLSAVDALQRLIDGDRRPPVQAFGGLRAGADIAEAEQHLVLQDMAVVDADRYPKPILCRVNRRHPHVDQVVVVGIDVVAPAARSEEHTFELQSLMRI